MKRWLQRFGFKESRYERPNQQWVCGGVSEGKSCPLGPDARGQCHAAGACEPIRQGDRWFCTRPTSAGGLCTEGPKPDGACCHRIDKCVPQLSLRARRGRVTWLTVAFTFGALLFFLSGPDRWRFVSPGPLTWQHSTSHLTCTDCHRAPLPAPQNGAGFSAPSAHHEQDSRLCLNCHQLGPEPLQPHGLPPAKRAELTRRLGADNDAPRPVSLALASLLPGSAADHDRERACATCHHEHRGKDFKMTRMDNTQCQSCHARPFESFSHGHPEFSAYPFTRRTRIFFDHISHLEKHFQDAQAKANAPGSCLGCHQTDAAGRLMLVKNFAATCAACHGRQIQGEGRADAPGVAVLRVPGLDARTLGERGLRIGDWPEQAEGKLTPFMQVLLSSDAKTSEAIKTLAKVDLLDLLDAKTNELKAAEQLVWGVKELFFDLTTKGQAALRERLAVVLHRELSAEELTRLAGQLPVDAVASAQTEWFPNLLTEVPLHREGGPLPPAKPAPTATKAAADKRSAGGSKPVSPDNWVARGGWYRSRNDYAVLYRPTGHADKFLQAWLDLSGAAQSQSPGTPVTALFKSLSATQAPGVCIKCHSVDADTDQRWTVNWHPAGPVTEHTFTKFSHRSHFSLLNQEGCQMCHKLAPQAAYQKAFENNFSPTVFTSNFKPISKAVCSSCHTAAGAGDGCLKCHDYHIGNFTPTLSKQGQSRQMPPPPTAKP